MNLRKLWLATFGLWCACNAMAREDADSTASDRSPIPIPATTNVWFGFEQLNFRVNGRDCLLVLPRTNSAGSSWIWRTEFFGHEPQGDLGLLSNGWHVAYMDVQNLYGAPAALDHMDRLYDQLT